MPCWVRVFASVLAFACLASPSRAAQKGYRDVIEAEDSSRVTPQPNSGIVVQGNHLIGFQKNEWIRFNALDLEDINQFIISVGDEGAGRVFELHIDAPNGPLIGHGVTKGGHTIWSGHYALSVSFPRVQGTHDVFLVGTYAPGTAWVATVDWLATREARDGAECGPPDPLPSPLRFVEAEDQTGLVSVQPGSGIVRQGNHLVGFQKNEWVRFNGLDFCGVDQIVVSVGDEGAGRTFTVRLDSPTGPLLGTAHTVGVKPTWTGHYPIPISIGEVSGIHDLYLVGATAPGTAWVATIDSISLEDTDSSCGTPPGTGGFNYSTVNPDFTRGFEVANHWSIAPGQIAGISLFPVSEGAFSLRVRPDGFSRLVSRPMPTIGPVNSIISVDVLPPDDPIGTLGLVVNIPSLGIHGLLLGQVDLATLTPGIFNTWETTLSAETQAILNSEYLDLEFELDFDVLAGNTDIYGLDNLVVGSTTSGSETPLPSDLPINREIVGLASSGALSVYIDGDLHTPDFNMGAFYVEEVDTGCQPNIFQLCRYIVHYMRFELGDFSISGHHVGRTTIFNLSPFRISIGGCGVNSMNALIPRDVEFAVSSRDGDQALTVKPGPVAALSISPVGTGLITFFGGFTGTVAGKSLDIQGLVVADSPLANRPPSANAGADQEVTTTDCEASITLEDGLTSSTDPDSNLAWAHWYDGSMDLGPGTIVGYPVHQSGPKVFRLVVGDTFGAISEDERIVTTTLGNTCN